MTFDEFEQLRDLAGKAISDDLEFVETAPNSDIFRCEQSLGVFAGHEILLTATFHRNIPSVVFNFRKAGFKAIGRYCVNGNLHRDKNTGVLVRTHKHAPESNDCFRKNLPLAYERTDLSIKSFKDVVAVWQSICKDANIHHSGGVIQR